MGKVMTTLNLPNEMEERLLRECRRLALSIPDYVATVLEERWEADDANAVLEESGQSLGAAQADPDA